MDIVKTTGVPSPTTKIQERTLLSVLPKYQPNSTPKRTMIKDRHGKKVPLSFDQITERNAALAAGLSRVNLTLVTEKVISDRSDDMTTADLDILSIGACEDLDIKEDSQYLELASAIGWSNLVKSAPRTFKESTTVAYEHHLLNEPYAKFTLEHIDEITAMMEDECAREEMPTYLRDRYSYLAYNMLTGTYLLKVQKSGTAHTVTTLVDGSQRETKKMFWVIERPSYALMRVAIQQHMPNLDSIRQAVQCYYDRGICPATPVWQYSGTVRSCVASCNLYSVHDSMAGIQKSWLQMSTISSRGGGLGGTWSHIRTKNSVIRTTGGLTKSAVSWCQFAQTISTLVNQGGKRDGSNAVYFDIAHGDVQDAIHLKSPNAGDDDIRCPSLHVALWCCDLFFARLEYQVQHDDQTVYWPMFNPDDSPEVMLTWGPKKTALIERLELEGKFTERVPIMKIWNAYLAAVGDKGEPYLLNADTVNAKSGHINMGTIDSANLCGEIVQWHSPDSIAVCILSSICLPSCLTVSPHPSDPDTLVYGFDFNELARYTRQAVRNLTATCMTGEQALPECKVNVDLLRSIAVGVQGQAEVFGRLHLPWESTQAAALNQLIYETMYYWALYESNQLVDKYGYYPGWDVVGPEGEVPPLKRGLFHWQLTGVQPAPMKSATDSCANSLGASPGLTPLTLNNSGDITSSPNPTTERGRHTVLIRYQSLDWDGLRANIKSKGVANSLVIGLMPTMSTSKIMGLTDSFEPSENVVMFKNNATSSSMHVFKPLYDDLHQLGIYSPQVLQHLQLNGGSVQELDLPSDVQWIKAVYLTVYQVKPDVRIKLAVAAQAFVDQSMSLNAYFDVPTKSLVTTWHNKAWRAGLKTGSYYTRSKPATQGSTVGHSREVKKPLVAIGGGKSTAPNLGTRSVAASISTGPRGPRVVKAAAPLSTVDHPKELKIKDEPLCSIKARMSGIDCDGCGA
jgi:ribonucleoside-diphosphate reductase alpha chain